MSTNNHGFPGIYTEPGIHPAQGAACTLTGRRSPARCGIVLPEQGWPGMSLQIQVLVRDTSFYDYEAVAPEAAQRISAAIAYLRAQGPERIALIAHSCGVHMSMAWLEQQGSGDIDAYIGIGMGATDYQQPMRKPFPFNRIELPLLNVYGSEDYPAVQRLAETLTPLLAEIHPYSRQIRINGADHYFDGYNEELAGSIAAWLATLPAAE